jgi:hypothetical protein
MSIIDILVAVKRDKKRKPHINIHEDNPTVSLIRILQPNSNTLLYLY